MERGHEVVLVEPGVSGARNARRRGLTNIVCATLESARPVPGAIGAAGLFDVIEHIEDDLGFLQTVHGYMEPGARLYATVPAYKFLWSNEDEVAGHFRRYTASGLSDVVRAAGFSVSYVTYFFCFLPLPVLLFRAIPSRLFGGRDAASERSASGGEQRAHVLQNRVVEKSIDALLQLEIRQIRSGRHLPFGGSCLIAATRR